MVVANLHDFNCSPGKVYYIQHLFIYQRRCESFGRFLNRHSSAKPIKNLNAIHFLRIEDCAICGDLVSPSCLCHPSKKVLPKPNVAVPIVGKFYCVMYLSAQRVKVLLPCALKVESRVNGLVCCN